MLGNEGTYRCPAWLYVLIDEQEIPKETVMDRMLMRRSQIVHMLRSDPSFWYLWREVALGTLCARGVCWPNLFS